MARKSTMSKERGYTDSSGRKLTLRSDLDVSGTGGWIIELWLYERRIFGRKLVDHRVLAKSGAWSTSAIRLLRAQEELSILQGADVEIDISGIQA